MTSRTSALSEASSLRWLDRGEGRIAYDISGSGPLVVCLPGMGEIRNLYRYNVGPLVDAGFTVVTMDIRGHGDSDATFSSYDDIAAGSDVTALIRHLGGPAIVIGNSMAGAVAIHAASGDPGLVAGLVLVGPLVRNQPTSLLTVLGQRLAMSRLWARPVWASYLGRLYPGRRPGDYIEHRSLIMASMRRRGHTQAFIKTTRVGFAAAEKRVDRVRSPVLVIMGTSDADFRDPAGEARWISERLHGEILMVPGAGHFPQVQYPEVVNPAMIAFAKRVVGQAGE